MMERSRYSLGRLLAYHGCDESVGEKVLRGKSELKPSENKYDWLGAGIYFWVDSPERALHWAREQAAKPKSKIKKPFVVGAFLSPGLCLNLTDHGTGQQLIDAYDIYKALTESASAPLAVNQRYEHGVSLVRNLDAAVIATLHTLREENGYEPYDSVYGVFEEGPPIFEGAGIREKTHIQIAVRNPDCILGYFRVPDL